MQYEKNLHSGGGVNDHSDTIHQVAALCLRKTDKGRDVLMVTSSEGRWILPKGWPMDGKTDAEAAEIEAWEEAGVKAASVDSEPVTRIRTEKQKRDGSLVPCDLDVFAVKLDRLVDDFPEAGKRKREWLPLKSAAKKAGDPELQEFLAGL